MQIIAVYIALVVAREFAAYLIGRSVEHWSPGASLPVFLACFFQVF